MTPPPRNCVDLIRHDPKEVEETGPMQITGTRWLSPQNFERICGTCRPLLILFNKSLLDEKSLSSQWKAGHITPIRKKGNKRDLMDLSVLPQL